MTNDEARMTKQCPKQQTRRHLPSCETKGGRLGVSSLALLLCFLFTTSTLRAEYLSAAEFARANGLEYKDMGLGTSHACKLSKNGREVILFDGMKNVLVDGSAVTLSQPVQWNGSSLMIPSEVTAQFGPASASNEAASSEASDEPVRGAPVPLVVPEHLNATATVVVDPGHGGEDPGTHGGGLIEKDINLDVAKRVATYLQAHGVKVVMTRTRDVTVSLPDRTDLANRLNPDLYLSIHSNWMPVSTLRGAMLLYPKEGVQFRAAAGSRGSTTISGSAVGAPGPISAAVE